MPFQVGHTPSQRGRSCTVQPVRRPEDIVAIKELLKDDPQDLAIWTLGTNSAMRPGDLTSLRREDISELDDGRLQVDYVEEKTKKRRLIVLNHPTSRVLKAHLESSRGPWVFSGQRGRFSVATIARKVKKWTAEVGVQGRYAAHSMRKTFVRRNVDMGAKLHVLQYCLNHSSPAQTLTYAGILPEEVAAVYANPI